MSEDNKNTTKKTEETAEVKDNAVDVKTENVPEKPVVTAANADTFVYIGPNLPKGLLKKGSVFTGTHTEVIKHLKDISADYPEIPSLLVTSDKLADAKMKIQTGGNLLASNFAKLTRRIKNK